MGMGALVTLTILTCLISSKAQTTTSGDFMASCLSEAGETCTFMKVKSVLFEQQGLKQ